MKFGAKPRTYRLLQDAIEVGLRCGYMKAHKHGKPASEEHIFDTQLNYIMLEIDERFEFDE